MEEYIQGYIKVVYTVRVRCSYKRAEGKEIKKSRISAIWLPKEDLQKNDNITNI